MTMDIEARRNESANTGELARLIAGAFRREGEEIYLVGGAVRDALLGRQSPEIDMATSALPEKTVRILQELHLGTAYRAGEKFGTIGLETGSSHVEITTYRSGERYTAGSRKPTVQFGNSLSDDLLRRDFTINAIAQDPLSGRLIDPLHGLDDVRARLLRAVGDPVTRFREDPLRLLRAVRLATRLDFAIDAPTWQALRTSGNQLTSISRERIRDEYSKILQAPNAVRGLTLLRDGDLFQHSVPQLLALTSMPDHGPRHPLSLWEHTMRVVAAVPPELIIRWAALLHDIGKPATRTHEPSGRPRFFHHEEVGASSAREILTGLRYSTQIVDAIVLLVETHMQPHSYSPDWSDGAIRRLMLRLGPCLHPSIALARADASGHVTSGSSANEPKFDHLEERLQTIDSDHVQSLRSPLSGRDLMERYGRPPGPWIKPIKETLRDEVLDGRLRPDDVDLAWQIADALVVRNSNPC